MKCRFSAFFSCYQINSTQQTRLSFSAHGEYPSFFKKMADVSNHAQHGFTLIEVVVALMISGLIGVALFTSFNQITRYATSTNTMMNFDNRLATIKHQLTKDLAGAFIPVQAIPETQQKKNDQKDQQKKQPTEEKPKEKKALKKIFMSNNNDESGSIKSLTFITNNPLISYGNVKPRIARVMYRLVPDKDTKGAYILYRQESTTELDAENFRQDNKKIRSFEVANNIKKLSIQYMTRQNKDSEKGKGELTAVKEWNADKKIQEYAQQQRQENKKSKQKNQEAAKQPKDKAHQLPPEKNDQEPFLVLPEYAVFEIVLWDADKKTERSSKGMVHIPAHAIIPEQKPTEEDQKKPDKKEEPSIQDSIRALMYGPQQAAQKGTPIKQQLLVLGGKK